MDIRQAKNQIKNAMKAYFAKDEFGNYLLPIDQQRPVFLMGAPGIGKTAIIQQIAQELEVGFVSYSMTHHTRQSALGLPFITEKTFGGSEYDISEYTMSEIIASVYEEMERSGRSEGILFLDEINCVSETLTPAMLQFLQYKTFGRHRVPNGWIVVTAGNPTQYNRTARDFDIATWDRMKRVDVDPDYDAWRMYAISSEVHPAVITYLDIERDHFYHMETTIDGASFVTARSWDDLSSMIKLYEAQNIAVDDLLIAQYLQDEEISRRFSSYYALFSKYRADYQVERILDGNADDSLLERARAASFDERISLLGLIGDALDVKLAAAMREEKAIALVHEKLSEIRDSEQHEDVSGNLLEITEAMLHSISTDREAGILSREQYFVQERSVQLIDSLLRDRRERMHENAANRLSFDRVKVLFKNNVDNLDEMIANTASSLENAFGFVSSVFGDDQEMLMLITDLSINRYGMEFINEHGCDAYFEHNKALEFYERGNDLARRIGKLDLNAQDTEK